MVELEIILEGGHKMRYSQISKKLKVKKFGENDLVYGPSVNGKLRQLQQRAGGRLLIDVGCPFAGESWAQFSIRVMENQVKSGGIIRFDISNIKDISGVLKNKGQYGNTVTGIELRYIQENWIKFSNSVKFYRNGLEISNPW